MKGRFYVVGTGPGDPELLTMKAVRIIRECDIIAIPVSGADFVGTCYEEEGGLIGKEELLSRCTAWNIVKQAVPEVKKKSKLYLAMPMMKEKEALKQIHDEDADALEGYLKEGKDIAFITLGDPSVYSTVMYIHCRLKERGYKTILIPGVPSFCAAAACLDTEIAKNKEEIHIIPASYEVEEGLTLPGTKILMKAGKKIPLVKEEVKRRGLDILMVENCGMPDERVYKDVDEIPDEASYYSLIIVKEEK